MTEKIIQFLIENIDTLQAIYLYGSMGEEKNSVTSDVDIAILAQKAVQNVERWELQSELSVILNNDVDLLDLCVTSDVMRFQVVGKGKLLWKKEGFNVDAYENLVYSMYLTLNEDRQEIIRTLKGKP